MDADGRDPEVCSGAALAARKTEVYALIKNIAFGENVKGVRVFVDRPDLTIDVPNSDRHYVRSFTFLNHDAGHANAGAATPLGRRQEDRKRAGEPHHHVKAFIRIPPLEARRNLYSTHSDSSHWHRPGKCRHGCAGVG